LIKHIDPVDKNHWITEINYRVSND